MPVSVIAAIVAGALIGGFAWLQTAKLEAAQEQLVLKHGQLETCAGRLGAILRDVRDDNAIDNLDLLDTDLPPEWRVHPGGAASP